MQLTGENSNGSYDYTIVIGTSTTRAKRDGRNPSTGAFTSNQSTKVVEDSLTYETGVGAIKVNIESYKSNNEIEEFEE